MDDKTELIHKPLKEEIFEVLRNQIIRGAYSTGDWLRQEEIAGEMGVSMTPVREALDLLIAAKFAQKIPYRGVRVVEVTQKDLVEAYGLLLTLECMAVQEASLNINQDQKNNLQKLLTHMLEAKAAGDLLRFRQTNRDIHLAIVESSNNKTLTNLYKIAVGIFADWRLYELYYNDAEKATEFMNEDYRNLQVIIFAISSGETEVATHNIVDYIIKLGHATAEYLKFPIDSFNTYDQSKTAELAMQDLAKEIEARHKITSRIETLRIIKSLLDNISFDIKEGKRLASFNEDEDETMSIYTYEIDPNERREEKLEWEFDPQSHIIIEIPLPKRVYFDKLFHVIHETIEAIDFLYSIFSLFEALSKNIFTSQDTDELLIFLKSNDNIDISKIHLEKFLFSAGIEPLRVEYLHYGSPSVADLLGVGQSLETIRDIVKDLAWRGKYERQLAELDIQNKHVDIHKSKLELEKTEIDIETKKLEMEKISVDIITKKLEIVERITKLRVSKGAKNTIISKALVIAENQTTLLPTTVKKQPKKRKKKD